MKNYIKLWCLAVLIMGLNSCTKSIDETKNFGTILPENLYGDAYLVRLHINQMYNDALPAWAWVRSPYFCEEGCGDGTVMGLLYSNVDGGAFTATDGNLYDWVQDRRMPGTWAAIRTINNFFANIDKATAQFAPGEKNWMRGQAYFLRAWNYYQFVVVFGGVAIIKEAQDPLAPASTLNLARNSSLECFDYMVEQLDSAIKNLPARGTAGYEAHRVDKVAAMALKSMTLVLKASPRFCNTKVLSYWQDAYNTVIATKTEANLKGFRLYDDGTPNAYAHIWYDRAEARKKEFLFYVPYEYPLKTDGNFYKSLRPLSARGEGTRWHPSWQHVQAYPMANGKEITTAGSGYDPTMFWANRDPRFYANIAFNGASYIFADYPGRHEWTFRSAPSPSADGAAGASTGFFMRKLVDTTLVAANIVTAGPDLAIIRYAELLLWHAECANEVNKSSEAFDQLKLIRQRARINPGTDGRYGLAAGVGTDYQATLNAIMKERQIELAYEGQRFWDYSRRLRFQELRDMQMFKTYIPDLNVAKFNAMKFRKRGTASFVSIPNVNSIPWTDVVNALDDSLNKVPQTIVNQILRDISTFKEEDWDKNAAHKLTIKDEYYFAPVYQGDINKSPAMLQNIGWPNGTFDPRITK